MCKDYCNLAVVGDDNQSIYKFRGANVENILTFEQRYKGCKKIVLHQNYRSTQEILDVSNVVMKYAQEGEKKVLHGQSKGLKPRLVITNTNEEEASRIIRIIRQHQMAGVPLKEIAIIARWSSQTTNIEIALNREGIPFRKFGGLKFLEKDAIQDLLAFLRVTVNETDELALYRLLKLYPGIGQKTSRKITMAVCSGGLDELLNVNPTVKYYPYLQELYTTLYSLTSLPLNKQLEFLIEDYYLNTVLRTIDLSSRNTEAKRDWKNKVLGQLEEAQMLITLADNYQSTSQYLMDLALEVSAPKSDDDFVNVTTVHSAKGLEYKTVFVLDLIDGVTPKTQAGMEEDNEELRCLYVALTRAKKNLYLFVPKQYRAGGCNLYSTVLSHFINHNDVLKTLDVSNTNDLQTLRTQNYWGNSYGRYSYGY